MRTQRSSHVSLTSGLLAGLVIAAACTAPSDRRDEARTPAAAPALDTAHPAAASKEAGMSEMSGMTGDADHDFLRMMSDHHKGLILLAHQAKDRPKPSATIADGRAVDAKQDVELDRMVTMLEKDFKDPYEPKVLPEHRAMHDALEAKSGKEFDRTFYQSVIAHHQQALTMIDRYLPTARNPAIRKMAETMKADGAREIRDFQQKLSRLGA